MLIRVRVLGLVSSFSAPNAGNLRHERCSLIPRRFLSQRSYSIERPRGVRHRRPTFMERDGVDEQQVARCEDSEQSL